MTDVMVLDEYEVALTPEEAAEQERLAEIERLRLIDPTPLRRMVQDFWDGTSPGREISDKCRRYFDGDQLDKAMMTALTRSRQPRVIRNEIAPAINGILGIIQQAKTDPRAWPRQPQNEEQSDQASKALRFVADKNRFHVTKVNAAETFLIEGVCAAIVEVDEKTDPRIVEIPFDEQIFDPRARQPDFSDALFKGIGKWVYEQDLSKMYPDFSDDLANAFAGDWGSAQMGMDRPDKPENLLATNWTDPKKRRLYVVELYHREDEWVRSVFYVGGVLEQGVSPYQDDEGMAVCPIEMAACLITKDNQRAGMVKSMLTVQDELNAYGSRLLYLARSRQLQVRDPSFPPEVDSKTASAEAAKPDGVIPSGYEVVPTADLSVGIQNMMGDARQALVRQAPTPAVLADASAANQSGRSRLVLQQAGMTEIARPLGRLENWENAIFRQCWARLKQFKVDQWWIRMTGDADKKPKFLGFNLPVGPDGQELSPQQAAQAQQMGMPVEIKNELAKMDVDIEVETIPDTANLQAEQFEALAPLFPQLMEAYGVKKGFQVAMALSATPGKSEIKDMLDAPEEIPPEQQQAQAQQAQMQQQIEQMQMQLAQMSAQAQIARDTSTAELNTAKAQQVLAQTRETEADTVLKAAQFNLGQPIDAS
jgi:hypothetical protein